MYMQIGCYFAQNIWIPEKSVRYLNDLNIRITDTKLSAIQIGSLKYYCLVFHRYLDPAINVTSFLSISCLSNSEHWSQKTS